MNIGSENRDLIRLNYQPEDISLSSGTGPRLDQFLADCLKQFSRAQLQKLIEEQLVLVDDKAEKASYRLRPGQELKITVPPPVASSIDPQAIPLDIIYEDEYLAVVNKAAGMVVHPGAGVHSGTLVHALLHHMQGRLSGIGGVLRPGIVHRLDKDTSGLLVVAKADGIHQHLAKQIQSKEAKRIYLAVLEGRLPAQSGCVDAPIGRHSGRRTEMAIVKGWTGRANYLHGFSRRPVWCSSCFDQKASNTFAWLELQLKTGRTHQIRVHMASLNCPVVGDLIYNRKLTGTAVAREKLGLTGHALHAYQLSFLHPVSHKLLEFRAPLPPDLSQLIDRLFPSPICILCRYN